MISVGAVLILFISQNVHTFKFSEIRESLDSLNAVDNDRASGARDVTCGLHKISPGLSYRIQTPLANYGIYVPSGYQCLWEFFGTEECYPAITCDTFSLPDTVNCTGANLEISDGYSVYEKFCDNRGPANVTSGSTIMQASFNSNLSPPSRGFICTVSCAVKSAQSSYQAVSNKYAPPITANCKCGVPGAASQSTSSGRIVGGKAAKPLFWKWQIALVPKTRRVPICGGSLINDRFILTAAHCVVTTGLVGFPAAADIVLNEYDLKNTSETITIRRSVLDAIPHPLYNTATQDYDFALLEFEKVSLTSAEEPKVTPVCLPARNVIDTYVGIIGTATGWGTLTEGGSQPDVLQEADIPIISNEECNKKYDNKITARMLCAAYPDGKIDACQGDSGGPFVVQSSDVYTSVGVTSWGEGCARAGKPGVYARVTEATDWIRIVTRTRSAVWCQE